MKHLSWVEARPYLIQCQPALVSIIDQLDPPVFLKLHHHAMNYGELLSKNGNFQLSESLTKPYQVVPAGVLLTRSLEIFMSTAHRIIPYSIIRPGELFGFSPFFNGLTKSSYQPELPKLMSIVAGARSLFSLSKLSNRVYLERLNNQFKYSFSQPQSFNEQWDLFSNLTKASQNSWVAEILLFNKDWLKFEKDPAWAPFYLYILQCTFKNQAFQRDFLAWQVIFSDIEESAQLRYSPHLLNTVKHLFAIAAGVVPGFAPQLCDEMAPVEFFKETITEIYGLKQLPVIMAPAYLQRDNPVYYSLAYSTLLDYSPKLSSNTQRQLLGLLPTVITKHRRALRDNKYPEARPKWVEMLDTIHFDFYHSDSSEFPIKSLESLLSEDQRFFANSSVGQFPWHSLFLKGLVSIHEA